MNNIIKVKVNNLKKDGNYQDIVNLYKSNFSFLERMPIFIINRKIKNNKYELHKYFDSNKFIGFSLVFIYKNYTLIHYIVIDKSLRGLGYGSQILKLIFDEYNNNTILLNSEYYDESNKDEVKVKRINFYKNNGFLINDFIINEYGVDYFPLSNKKVSEEEYHEVVKNTFNKLLAKIFTKTKKIKK